MKRYGNLNIPSNYTGTVVVSKRMQEEYKGRAFIDPHSYQSRTVTEF